MARRAEVDAAARATSAHDRQAAVEAFERLAGLRRRRRLPLWLAAAGLIGVTALAFALWKRGAASEPSAPPVLMGFTGLTDLTPSGSVPGYDRFAWSASGDLSLTYSLRIWNEGELDPAVAVDDLTERAYALSESERQRLGPRLRWQVLARAADGRTLGSATASAERR